MDEFCLGCVWLSFIILVGEIKRQMKVTTGLASDATTGRLVEDLKMTKMPENGVVLGKRKVCCIVVIFCR